MTIDPLLAAAARDHGAAVDHSGVPQAVGQGPAGGTADDYSAVRERPWHLPIQSV